MKCLAFVAIFHTTALSFLGHKEWRFIMYTLPAFNVVATAGVKVFYSSKTGRTFLTCLFLLQFGMSWFSGYISGLNYPGGTALALLHHEAALSPHDYGFVKLHVDVLPAMSGVTLFQSIHLDRDMQEHGWSLLPAAVPDTPGPGVYWAYDKTEDLPVTGAAASVVWQPFTHLLSESPQCSILQSSPEEIAAGASIHLPEDQQPFVEMGIAVRSYAGLRRKTIQDIRESLYTLAASASELWPFPNSFAQLKAFLDHAFRLLLPLQIVENETVWLCRRKPS
jgi:alpha-1,6-mannosyltransferase